jgi:hypothetical protein
VILAKAMRAKIGRMAITRVSAPRSNTWNCGRADRCLSRRASPAREQCLKCRPRHGQYRRSKPESGSEIFSDRGGLVLAESRPRRFAGGDTPPHDIINADGLIMIQTVWATMPDRRRGHRLTRVDRRNRTNPSLRDSSLLDHRGRSYRSANRGTGSAGATIALARPLRQNDRVESSRPMPLLRR